jgi:RimJ/RimL family protein N-acetyltransferase
MANKDKIPDATMETLARTFFKEASSYGFRQADYVRFVNMMLDYAMTHEFVNHEDKEKPTPSMQEIIDRFRGTQSMSLPLIGARIKIRFYQDSDRKLFNRWIKDEAGQNFMLSRTTARSLPLKQLLTNESNIVGVITLKDDTPIGAVAYLGYDVQHLKAELRKLIGEPGMRGKGYAKEATELWIRYGITSLDLKKIYVNTFETNIRNVRLNEELGFRVEGILRNEVFLNGEYKDVLRMSLWRE